MASATSWREGVAGPVGEIDTPAPGCCVAPLFVRGWVIWPGSAISSIDVVIAGRRLRATIGLPRPDVAELLDDVEGATAGFEVLVGAETYAISEAESHLLVVVVTSLQGQRAVLRAARRRVSATVQDRPGAPMRESGRSVLEPARPRVMMVTAHLGVGGATLRTLEALTLLHERGVLELMVRSYGSGVLEERVRASGIDVGVVSGTPELSASMTADEPDVVIAVSLLAVDAIDAADRLGLLCVLDIHESLPLDEFYLRVASSDAERALEALAPRALACADAVVVPTEYTRGVHARWRDEMEVIVAGVDVDELATRDCRTDIDELRVELGFGPEDLVVVCVGMFAGHKGQVVLARARQRLDQLGVRCRVVLVGNDGGDYGQALATTFAADIAARSLVVVDATEDVAVWYRLADVVVCASDNETLPGVVLEAMACGRPVVSTDVGAVTEVIEHGVSGWLVAANDARAMAEVVGDVLQMRPEQRRKVAANGSAVVTERYSIEQRVEGFERLLESFRC